MGRKLQETFDCSKNSAFYTRLPACEDGTDRCSETSAYKLQTPGNYPKESIQQKDKTTPDIQEEHSTKTITLYFMSLI
jgi:hypothetical protein